MMQKFNNLAIAIGAGLCFSAIARADDIQFTTLPQTVQTTVIHETRISDASSVTHIVRSNDGIYAVTVRGTKGEQKVYVNEAGVAVPAPVSAPVSTTVVQKSTQIVQQPAAETVQTVTESPQTVVAYDQVQQNTSRYVLLEKKGKKEVYRDNQTGQKVTVKRD
jgi:hypothetical protein